MPKLYNQLLVTRSKKLREKLTDQERILWGQLRDKRFHNIRFKRQQVIGPYIVDFYSKETNLIIELDGGHHNKEAQAEYDQSRTEYLEEKGYRVIRFWNQEISFKNLKNVLSIIYEAIKPHLPDCA